MYVGTQRAADDAAAFFGHAIEATGGIPTEVTTDCAAACPPALAVVLPGAAHATGKQVQQRIERDQQHLQGRIRGMRGFKTLAGARVVCGAHAFLRNRYDGCYDLGHAVNAASTRSVAPMVRAWALLPAELLAR